METVKSEMVLIFSPLLAIIMCISLVQANPLLSWGTPEKIGDGFGNYDRNSGSHATLLYRPETDQVIAVWDGGNARYRKMTNGTWEPEVQTPFSISHSMDADFDSQGNLHFTWNFSYGYETSPGQFSGVEQISYSCAGSGSNGSGRKACIALDNQDNAYTFIRGAWVSNDEHEIMMRRAGGGYRSLGNPGNRPLESGCSANYDKSMVHFAWGTVTPGSHQVGTGHRAINSGGSYAGGSQLVMGYTSPKCEFYPRLAPDAHNAMHMISVNANAKFSYMKWENGNWSNEEVIDNRNAGSDKLNDFNIAVDTKGNVMVFYPIEGIWNLKIRTPQGSWSDIIPLEGKHYHPVGSADGKIHFIYSNNGVMYNWVQEGVALNSTPLTIKSAISRNDLSKFIALPGICPDHDKLNHSVFTLLGQRNEHLLKAGVVIKNQSK